MKKTRFIIELSCSMTAIFTVGLVTKLGDDSLVCLLPGICVARRYTAHYLTVILTSSTPTTLIGGFYLLDIIKIVCCLVSAGKEIDCSLLDSDIDFVSTYDTHWGNFVC